MSQSLETRFVVSFDGFCGSEDDPLKMRFSSTENRDSHPGYLVPDCFNNVVKVQ